MALRQLTPPTGEVVSLAELKKHCRCEYHDDDDDYLKSLADAALANIDGPEGWLGRAVREQTLVMTLDCFPSGCGRIRLPLPPLKSVEGVEYDAPDGTTKTVAFTFGGVDEPFGGYVIPAATWPAVARNGTARISFTAGPVTATSIKHAILLMVGHWFENREAVAEAKMADLPMGVSALLTPHRVW